MQDHAFWMRHCMELARKGAGSVSTNPMVGCVILDEQGMVLGEGYHERFGGAHAEVNAIGQAIERHGEDVLTTATLYVNLEPCSHVGKTPPCADLILEKRIPRVVTAMPDPNPQVQGRGIARLRTHGVDVTENVLRAEAERLNEAFIRHMMTKRPMVFLKIAQTLDGWIATNSGDSRWVSGEAARRMVHEWRATLDAVLIGAETARVDDPALTVRHVAGRQPLRVVLDRRGRLPEALQLFQDDFVPQTVSFVNAGVSTAYAEVIHKKGGKLVYKSGENPIWGLADVLDALGSGIAGKPVQSVLVEAGPTLATALLRENLVDRLLVFIAPKLLGSGKPAFYDLGITQMASASTFSEFSWMPVGDDLLFTGFAPLP